MKNPHTDILECLDQIINDTATHIHDFIDSKEAFTRRRKLTAFDTIKTTINMQGNCLDKELFDAFGNDQNKLMSSSAYVQQKAKLSPACFKHIFEALNRKLVLNNLLDNKYRVFAIDGSDFNQIWNPKSKNIVKSYSSKKKTYCQFHANAIYDLMNNTYQDCITQPINQMDERSAAIEMLKKLDVGPYIVIMDRGYTGFNMIENCNRLKNCNYIIRTKANVTAIKEIQALPQQECDQLIQCRVTTSGSYYKAHRQEIHLHWLQHFNHQYKACRSKNTKDSRWDFEQFCWVKFRACKIKINDPESGKEIWEVLLTNLDRNKFPLSRIKELYHLRWGIESSFRKLKYDIGSIQFHSKQDKFIEMELYAHLIMFNVVSLISIQAYIPQHKTKYRYVINFKMSCIVIHKQYCHTSHNFEEILLEIERYVVPVRQGRKDQRNIKPKSAICLIYRVA